MKMTAIEKSFVNRPSHTRRVAGHALQLLYRVNYQDGWRYLDVGCGVGAAAQEIAATTGLPVTGVDIDPQQIEAASAGAASPNPQFKVMNAARLTFEDGAFDVVATHMATHHIPDWEQVFCEMARVLRPGGHLIYTDFIFPRWLARIFPRFIHFAGMPSIAVLNLLASENGLAKVYETRYSGKVDVIWMKNG